MVGDRYDYIVVGAGSAGCILAHRLASDGKTTVLLLEAGPHDRHWTIRMPGGLRAHYDLKSRFNWHLSTVPQPHLEARAIYQPRGKTLGGSSSINGMVYLRGHRLDYDNWAAQGAAGWSYADVLPYFKRLERFEPGGDRYRGDDGPVVVRRQEQLGPLEHAFLAAGREAGFPFTPDVNGAEQEGFCRFDMNVDGGVRASTAYAYLHKSHNGPNLTIRTDSHCRRILIEKSRACGIAYTWRGRLAEAHADREVVVSAGAIGSPHLLMLSGVGPADPLHKLGIDVCVDLPGVGANLHDHLEIHVQHRASQPVSLNRYLRKDRMAAAGVQWFLFKAGVTARNQANVGAFLRSCHDAAQPNTQFHFFPVFFDGWTPSAGTFGYRLGSGTMRPTSRGTVRLCTADPTVPPAIDPNYLATEDDLRDMREAFALARETLAQKAFAPYDAGETDPGPDTRTAAEIDRYIRRAAGSAYHPCGTCKMGSDSDPLAVTDPEGRVRGISGLRVADASLMPTIVSSNINAPTMMIGEKIAAAIRGDHATN